MTNNRMKDIAKMFGVELGEPFDIIHSQFNPHHFDDDGLN